jgi:hypothetical protein
MPLLPTEDANVVFLGGPNFDGLKSDSHVIKIAGNETMKVNIIGGASIQVGATGAGFVMFEVDDITNPQKVTKRYINASAIVEWVTNPSGRFA